MSEAERVILPLVIGLGIIALVAVITIWIDNE